MEKIKEYRPAEAAQKLNVSTGYLAELARAGRIEANTTAGGHRRYTEEQLERAREYLAGEVSNTSLRLAVDTETCEQCGGKDNECDFCSGGGLVNVTKIVRRKEPCIGPFDLDKGDIYLAIHAVSGAGFGIATLGVIIGHVIIGFVLAGIFCIPLAIIHVARILEDRDDKARYEEVSWQRSVPHGYYGQERRRPIPKSEYEQRKDNE